MGEPLHWVRDGEILKDAGDVGGDIQVGPAVQIRFRSDAVPGSRFEVTVYATAKTYEDVKEPVPACPHPSVILERHEGGTATFAPMPPEHLECSYKRGTVDVRAQFEYRRNGTTENGYYESDDADHVTYDWVGSDIGYDHGGRRSLTEEIEYASADAAKVVMDWANFVNTWLRWDGVSDVND